MGTNVALKSKETVNWLKDNDAQDLQNRPTLWSAQPTLFGQYFLISYLDNEEHSFLWKGQVFFLNMPLKVQVERKFFDLIEVITNALYTK